MSVESKMVFHESLGRLLESSIAFYWNVQFRFNAKITWYMTYRFFFILIKSNILQIVIFSLFKLQCSIIKMNSVYLENKNIQ